MKGLKKVLNTFINILEAIAFVFYEEPKYKYCDELDDIHIHAPESSENRTEQNRTEQNRTNNYFRSVA